MNKAEEDFHKLEAATARAKKKWEKTHEKLKDFGGHLRYHAAMRDRHAWCYAQEVELEAFEVILKNASL